jgi:hypothetical protein
MSDEKKMDNNAETIVKVVGTLAEKTVIPIYEDLAKPSLKQIGEGLGGFLSIAMMPLQMMGYQAEHWKSEFQKSLDKKASQIPEERLQSPDLIITGPIMQALGYTVHKDDLRELFTNLLTTSMDSKTAREALPCFVEIIKQISPDEAKILRLLSNNLPKPVVDVMSVTLDQSTINYLHREESFIPEDVGCEHAELGPQYLGNLLRLGLINLPEDVPLSDPKNYERLNQWFEETFKDRENYEKIENVQLKLRKRRVRMSRLGTMFLNACVLERGVSR